VTGSSGQRNAATTSMPTASSCATPVITDQVEPLSKSRMRLSAELKKMAQDAIFRSLLCNELQHPSSAEENSDSLISGSSPPGKVLAAPGGSRFGVLWRLAMATKSKTFSCVKMERRAQRLLQQEYEARRGEFPSSRDFFTARANESELANLARRKSAAAAAR